MGDVAGTKYGEFRYTKSEMERVTTVWHQKGDLGCFPMNKIFVFILSTEFSLQTNVSQTHGALSLKIKFAVHPDLVCFYLYLIQLEVACHFLQKSEIY